MVKLAQELQRLSLAEEEYLNYFLWKAELREENQVERLHANWKGCQLCKALNQQRPSNSYHDNALITGTLLMPCLAPAALGLVELCKNWRKWRKLRDFFVFLFRDTFVYNKMSRNRRNDKIPSVRGTLLFLMFLDIFCNKKCLETGETTKSLEEVIFSRDFVVSHVS